MKKSFRLPSFKFAGISAGIKKNGKKDLALIYSTVPAQAAGTFTTNRVKSASVILDQERLRRNRCQAIIINSGNANAGTGKRGISDAARMARETARLLRIDERLVMVASTGVIGRPLPMDRITRAIPRLTGSLSSGNLRQAAEAIMTTDTFSKISSRKTRIGGQEITLGGITKGAGMIQPRMATMLAFLVTDAAIDRRSLRSAFRWGVENSFNRITIDGDMSTNDTALILANGTAGNRTIASGTRDFKSFQALLKEVMAELAEAIVRDGEGATKFVRILVKRARSQADARAVAFKVANSPLVKTAIFGEDPNWGRILAAAGSAGVSLNPERIDIYFDNLQLVRKGVSSGEEAEKKAGRVLKNKRLRITVDLNLGKAKAEISTCDLTPDYVKINAAYRT
ncbi:MAG: bifunctional glutamate N-acetyltransferase/amino-acid acetyltransferase ArgJ [Deltaproteobacteria bacterium]|nr:MAG: bifunctional glutamate N-acetyltransferase/amino-acid acetyltransferase ArgJ [Deltaproteobacteria bacterium]